MPNSSITYRDAGVNIDAGNEAVSRMKEHIRSTFNPNVLTDVGSFGGMFSLAGISAYEHPVLVSSMDGVGEGRQDDLAGDPLDARNVAVSSNEKCLVHVGCGAERAWIQDVVVVNRHEGLRRDRERRAQEDGGCSGKAKLWHGDKKTICAVYSAFLRTQGLKCARENGKMGGARPIR